MITDFLGRQLQALLAMPEQRVVTLSRHLNLALRQAIKDQLLRPGERLPSSRDLAADLGLARNTVISALSQLEAEGFLETRRGSGSYVRYKLPGHSLGQAQVKSGAPTPAVPRSVSTRGARLLKQAVADELEVEPFTQGFPDFSPFPIALWQKLQNKHWRLSYAEMMDYNDTGGFMPLKRAIAQYLRMFRNMKLEDDQVLVTTGTQQSLSLCATLLADPGDTVWGEDPLYWGAAQTFRASGLKLHGIPTDAQGMNLVHAERAPPARMVYVTPSHQYPTGGVLSLERRQELLQRCRDMQSWVLEDDYDSEFRFSGPAMSSMHGLDVSDRVFYMGTFSKALYPGIKMAYLVVPKVWVHAFKRVHYDLHRPGLVHQQVAMAEFIELGHFHNTIRSARKHYAERRHALLQALAPCLKSEAHLSGAEQGLHLCGQLSLSSMALMRERMETYAIDCHPVWRYLTVADRPRKAEALLQEARHMQSHYGYDMRYVQKADLHQHIGSDRYVAGLLDPESGHINPLRYGLGMARAAAAKGVRMHENSPALSMHRAGQHWLVRTDQAQVRARHVVLAGNCGMLWQSPQLAKRLHARIMPVGTYVVATEALSTPLAQQLLPLRAAVCDNNFVLDYFRLSKDQRMLFGGRVSYTTATPSRLTEVMRQRMVKVFPQLAQTRIDHTWGGFVDISRERAPDWGRFDDGVYHVQGFSGHGLAATTLAGRVVTQAILGDAQALSAFERIRQSPFPGGAFWRVPLLVAGTSYFRLRDWLG